MRNSIAWLLLLSLGMVFFVPSQIHAISGSPVSAELAKICPDGMKGTPPPGAEFAINPSSKAAIRDYVRKVACASACFDATVSVSIEMPKLTVKTELANYCRGTKNPTPEDAKKAERGCEFKSQPQITLKVITSGTTKGPVSRCYAEIGDTIDGALGAITTMDMPGAKKAIDLLDRLSSQAPVITSSIGAATNELLGQLGLDGESLQKIAKAGNTEALLEAIGEKNQEKIQELLKSSGVTLTSAVQSEIEKLVASKEDPDGEDEEGDEGDGDPNAPPNTFPTDISAQRKVTDMDRAKHAICKIESGCNYGRVGPVVNKGMYAGDRAYGMYQVMGKNVVAWSCEMGQCMTPQQFLADPAAQDRLFEYKFGQLAARHGWEGAASRWFGPGTDQLGTTNASYRARFMAYFNGEVPSDYSRFTVSPFGSISTIARGDVPSSGLSPFSMFSNPAPSSAYAQPSYAQSAAPAPVNTSAGGYTYSQQANTLPPPTQVSSLNPSSSSVTPSAQADALEKALKKPGTTPSATSASPVEPAAAIIVQPGSIVRGASLVVSWSSTGMSTANPCKVYVRSGGTNVELARDNEGSRTIPTKATSAVGKWNFELSCVSAGGTTFEKSASAEIR
jgi:hypothetical protein